jgi:diguanylate cyclase (GGDEF)-like protein
VRSGRGSDVEGIEEKQLSDHGARELNDFQTRNIELLAILLKNKGFDYRIVELLRESELDYQSMAYKLARLQARVDIDEKTNLFKFKPEYLTNIIKMVSRIYDKGSTHTFEISLARFDIDDFSDLNSRYGHEAGDQVLIGVADLLRRHTRPTDHVIRFGGDEFDVLFHATNLDGAEICLHKIYDHVCDLDVMARYEGLKVSLSAGISFYQYQLDGNRIINDAEITKAYEDLRARADDALYEAKSLGKNCFRSYQPDKLNLYAKVRSSYSRGRDN